MGTLDNQLADMRQAATILRGLGIGDYAKLIEEIATATAHAQRAPVSIGEQLRWTPTMCVAGELARQIVQAVGGEPAGKPHHLGLAQ